MEFAKVQSGRVRCLDQGFEHEHLGANSFSGADKIWKPFLLKLTCLGQASFLVFMFQCPHVNPFCILLVPLRICASKA